VREKRAIWSGSSTLTLMSTTTAAAAPGRSGGAALGTLAPALATPLTSIGHGLEVVVRRKHTQRGGLSIFWYNFYVYATCTLNTVRTYNEIILKPFFLREEREGAVGLFLENYLLVD